MRIPAIISPVPLAFLLFPFTFAMQVLMQSAFIALIPYALFFVSMLFVAAKALSEKRINYGVRGFKNIDIIVAIFLLFNAVHIVFGVMLNGYSVAEAMRLFLIYVVSGWIYFYVSRWSKETEIKMVIMATAIAGIIVSAHWVDETIMKNIFFEISDYQRMVVSYLEMRGANLEDAPLSIVPQYVAYGLVSNHAATGATVAIGAFALMAICPNLKKKNRLTIAGLFLLVLIIGRAKLAMLSYLLLIPVMLSLLDQRIGAFRAAMSTIKPIFIALITIVLLLVTTTFGHELLSVILRQGDSFATLVNLGETKFSWLALLLRKIDDYWSVICDRPFMILFGQGLKGYGSIYFRTGGDFAFLDMIAKYGIPMSILILLVCIKSLLLSIKRLKSGLLPLFERHYLLFGFLVILFLLFSLAHYAILHQKSILVCFFLALGLIRRGTGLAIAEQ
jgi:hypothetical protein